MNREHRRKVAKKNKIKDDLIKKAQQMLIGMEIDAITRKAICQNGAKVMLDVDAIKKQKGYNNYQPAYKKFIEDNEGKVLTVVLDDTWRKHNVVCFEEDTHDPKWAVWYGFLSLMKENKEQDGA